MKAVPEDAKQVAATAMAGGAAALERLADSDFAGPLALADAANAALSAAHDAHTIRWESEYREAVAMLRLYADDTEYDSGFAARAFLARIEGAA